MTGTSGRSSLRLGQEFKPAHPRHVDVGEDQDERTRRRIGDALKCRGGGLGKLHGEAAGAEVAPELLAEQHLDIRLIIDHENEQVHARSPDLISGRSPRAAERSEIR